MGHVCAKDPGPAGRYRAMQDGQSQSRVRALEDWKITFLGNLKTPKISLICQEREDGK